MDRKKDWIQIIFCGVRLRRSFNCGTEYHGILVKTNNQSWNLDILNSYIMKHLGSESKQPRLSWDGKRGRYRRFLEKNRSLRGTIRDNV